MELYTRILLPKARFSFSYEDRVVMMGSCFAENIGRKLEENKFSVDINPFGTLYNPASVAEGLRMLLRPEYFTPGDLFQHEGIYHSFTHHSRFSAPSEEECLGHINSRLSESSDFLRKATRLVITLGTAFVYRLKSDGRIVSNCHKLPEKMFDRQRLSTQEIVEDWKPLLLALWEQNPALKILFTVSPIRHWKDGAHENQLSKATLLLATDALQKDYPDRIAYFPLMRSLWTSSGIIVSMRTICSIPPHWPLIIFGNVLSKISYPQTLRQSLKNGVIFKKLLTISPFNRIARPISGLSFKLC